MDSDKAGNPEDLDNEKLQLICKTYNRELLSNQRVVDGINSMYDSKLKILCKYNNKFSHKGIEELLSNKEIVDNINGYDDEMFRSILDCASSELNILEILKGGKICNINNEFESSDSEEDKDLSDFFDCKESDSEEGEVKEDILKLQQEDPEIAKNLSFIDNQTLKVICKKFSPSDIKALLENQAVVVNITDYNNKELKHVFNICGSLAIQNIIKVLSINPKKLRLICNKCNFSDTRTLLENQKVVKHLSFIDDQTFKVICNSKYSDQSTSIDNKIIKLLEKKEIVENICSIGYEKLTLFILNNDEKRRFFLSDVIKLLENQEIVNNIIDYKIQELKLVFYSYELSPQNIIKVLENINPKKLRLIFERFSPSNTQTLLENQKIVYNISDYKTEELQLLFYSYELSPQNIIKVLKNITPKKLRLICNNKKFSSSDIKTLLENQEIVKRIGSSTSRESELIFGKFSLQDIIKVLENIAPEKSELIFEKFSLQDIIEVLEDQNAVKGINSVTTKELKAITDNVTGKVFVNIFKNFKPSVKSTLRLAILLRKAGKITDINIDYLNNKERIYEDIIKYVPQDLRIYTQYPFPGIGIDVKDLPQGLDIDIEPFIPLPTFKRCTESKEPVSKLYNLSLEQVIENINPHKKARYS